MALLASRSQSPPPTLPARLDMTIEAETYQAMQTHAAQLDRCAAARVIEEIYRS